MRIRQEVQEMLRAASLTRAQYRIDACCFSPIIYFLLLTTRVVAAGNRSARAMDLHSARILILKPSSLGDIIHTLPLVHCLKRTWPGCHIGWVVQEAFTRIVENDPAVDAVHQINIPSTSDPRAGRMAFFHAVKETRRTLTRLRKEFQANPYDLVLDLHASFRSGLLGRTSPGAKRVGFAGARELNTLFQDQLITVPPATVHALEKNLLFCDHLGCSVAEEDFFLGSGDAAERRINALLAGYGITPDDRIAYMHTTARWNTKFWFPERWARLADRLIDNEGMKVIFGGSGADREYILAIEAKMTKVPIVAAGRCNLAETASLLSRCSVYVGLDSGPMHMAAMAGVPVVALFGPTHPERVGPYGVEHVIVKAGNLDCLGCRRRTCGTMTCMERIPVDMVYDATVRLLRQQKGQGGWIH
jgi:heptosyltransferase-1